MISIRIAGAVALVALVWAAWPARHAAVVKPATAYDMADSPAVGTILDP